MRVIECRADGTPKTSQHVADWTTAGFIPITGSTRRDLSQGGATLDGVGNLSTQGGDLTTSGGDVIVGSGLVDGVDVSTLDVGTDEYHRWSSRNASSGNTFLFTGIALNAGSGTSSYAQQMANQAMTLKRFSVSMELTAYSSGAPVLTLYKRSGGTNTLLDSITLATPSGTGEYRDDGEDGVAGLDLSAFQWAAGDYMIALMQFGEAGASMTGDEIVLETWSQHDARWEPN